MYDSLLSSTLLKDKNVAKGFGQYALNDIATGSDPNPTLFQAHYLNQLHIFQCQNVFSMFGNFHVKSMLGQYCQSNVRMQGWFKI
jgi:hypothetical protein